MAISLPCFAQTDALTVVPPSKVVLKRGESANLRLQVRVKPEYHVNSNKPNEDYLIPLRLTWDPKPLQVGAIKFPPPKNEKFEFSEKPVSVYTNDFAVETEVKTPADAPVGLGFASGKLRYQACNLKMCLTPKTIPIQVPIEVR